MSETTDLRAAMEGHDGIFVFRAGKNCRGWNGIHYQVVENTAGDFIFIEPGVPHEVFNASDTDPVVARSDASE